MTRPSIPFTIEDYRRLPEGYPAQLIDGALVKEPSPTIWCRPIVLRLGTVFCDHVGLERVLTSPMDFTLDEENVFRPDVAVFPTPILADPEDREIDTSLPVVEVLSPSTVDRDRGVKTGRDLGRGVREAWPVDPVARTVEIRTRDRSRVPGPAEALLSDALPELAEPPDLHGPGQPMECHPLRIRERLEIASPSRFPDS